MYRPHTLERDKVLNFYTFTLTSILTPGIPTFKRVYS